MLWRIFSLGVLSDPLEIVAKRMMPLAAAEIIFKMQEQINFEIQKEVKNAGISDPTERMYQLDFIEPRTKFKNLMRNIMDEVSYEDFFKILEDQGIIMKSLCY